MYLTHVLFLCEIIFLILYTVAGKQSKFNRHDCDVKPKFLKITPRFTLSTRRSSVPVYHYFHSLHSCKKWTAHTANLGNNAFRSLQECIRIAFPVCKPYRRNIRNKRKPIEELKAKVRDKRKRKYYWARS